MNKIILFLAREKRDFGTHAKYCKALEKSSKITCSINTANKKSQKPGHPWYFFFLINVELLLFVSAGKTYLQFYKKVNEEAGFTLQITFPKYISLLMQQHAKWR